MKKHSATLILIACLCATDAAVAIDVAASAAIAGWIGHVPLTQQGKEVSDADAAVGDILAVARAPRAGVETGRADPDCHLQRFARLEQRRLAAQRALVIQRDEAPQACLAGQVDDRHATAAELPQDLEVANV